MLFNCADLPQNYFTISYLTPKKPTSILQTPSKLEYLEACHEPLTNILYVNNLHCSGQFKRGSFRPVNVGNNFE